MGLFSQDKTSTTTQSFDERLAASDQAVANRGAQQLGGLIGQQQSTGNVAGSNVIGVGGHQAQHSNVAEAGGFLLQGGSKADIHNENVDDKVIGAFGTTLSDILKTQGQTGSEQTAALKDLVNTQADQANSFFTDIAGKLSDLSKNTTTGGDTDRNKIILYVVLAVLALLGILAWRKS